MSETAYIAIGLTIYLIGMYNGYKLYPWMKEDPNNPKYILRGAIILLIVITCFVVIANYR